MVNKAEILEKLKKIKNKDAKIRFIENLVRKIKDREFIRILQELLEELKSPEIEQIVRQERFTAPEIKALPKKETLEESIRREEQKIKKEETKEKKYVSTLDYGSKRVKYQDTRVESPFFDKLKMRLDNAGLLPNDMIFTDKNIKDIKIYMGKMDIQKDKIEKYVERITDLKHSLYDPVKAKKLDVFETEYERE